MKKFKQATKAMTKREKIILPTYMISHLVKWAAFVSYAQDPKKGDVIIMNDKQSRDYAAYFLEKSFTDLEVTTFETTIDYAISVI